MGECIGDQFRNVIITKFVIDVLSFTCGFDNPLTLQQLEPLRNRGKVVIHCVGDLGHTHLAGTYEHQDPQPVEVAQSAEQVRCSLTRETIEHGVPKPPTASVIVLGTFRRV